MNVGPFGIYNDGPGWLVSQRNVKTETYPLATTTSSVGDSHHGRDAACGYVETYALSRRVDQQQQQQNQLLHCYHQVQQHQSNDSSSPASYYSGVMDLQSIDDFEAYTRERCHTWPSVQQRSPGLTGEQQEEGTNDDHNHQQFSPPPLPSRGSSGLSLISESNESLVATSTSSGPGTVGGDWTSTSVTGMGGNYAANDYTDGTNSNVQVHAQQSSRTKVSTSALPVSTPNKRSIPPTPSYKSGHPSYVELITQAILSSPEKRMTLSEIYDWMVANVPSFKDQRHLHSSAGWKNSVRHNLSLHARFKRVKRNGMDKPSWWTVDLSEEAKRERSKRPRQSRPRANTTTATSREFQTQRQQQQQQQQQPRNMQGRGQSRASLGFAQPHMLCQSDHASSGHGSMSFSGSLTPASSVGSDTFLLGTSATASNVSVNAVQYKSPQQLSPMLHDPLMPPPPLPPGHFLNATTGDGSIAEECMDWTQYASNSSSFIPMTSVERCNDHLVDEVTNPAESGTLHCLSQAITVSLRDPAVTSVDGANKPDVALNVTTTPVKMPETEAATTNYFGTGNVSNLVHALRQNTLDEKNNASSRQMLRVQTTVGHVQEVSVPVPVPINIVVRTDKTCQTEQLQQVQCEWNVLETSASCLQMNSLAHRSPLSSCVVQQQQQHQAHQGASAKVSPGRLPPSPMSQCQQQSAGPSPVPRQFCPTGYAQHRNVKKETVSGASSQLPDDLAALDVGVLDCNIMDVLSYEMNCGSNNAARYV